MGDLHRLFDLRRRRDRGRSAVPHRRLRLRRLVRRAVRPARRRHLHQGRRRRRRPRRQGREGHPRRRPPQRGRDRGPGRRQRRRLRRSWRRPVRIDRRREHRRDDPGRRGVRHRGDHRAGRTRGLDLLPARRPRLRAAGDDRRDLLRPRQGRREPDEHAQPRLLGHDPAVRGGPAITLRVMMNTNGHDRERRLPDVGLLLRGRHRRPRDQRSLRVHHPVLHGRFVSTGPRDRRGVQDGPGHEHHLGHGGRLRDHSRDRHHDLPSPCSPATGWATRRTSSRRPGSTSAASSGRPSPPWAC